jgi:thiosulfate dehydrogenase
MQTFLKVLGTCILGVSFMWAGSAPKKYPDGELGRMVKLGEAIMMDTSNHPLTKDFVGNKLLLC